MTKKMIEFSHHSLATDWRWRHFTPAELASKGDGSLKLDEASLDMLEVLRIRIDAPMLVTSAYRDPAHNRRVGGATGSYHMKGQAFDIRMENHDPVEFEAVARSVGFKGFGYYPRQGFMHIDTGPARSWGTKFPIRETRFAPEEVPARVTQAAKEGGTVTLVAVAAERVLTEAAPVLPDHIMTWGFTALAAVALGVVVWRAMKMGRE